MKTYRPVESGIANLIPALQGKPNAVRRLITLDKDIDESMLQEAIRRTVAVYPLLGKKIEGQDGVYFYSDNDLPFVISQGFKEIKPSLPEGNFHSMTFAYEKNRLCILMDHIFFDGSGIKSVLETLFYFYFCLADGKDYAVPEGVNVIFSPDFTAEPFPNTFTTDDSPLFDNNAFSGEFFRFPELDAAKDLYAVTQLVTLSADSGELMGYAKSIGGTPLTCLANLFFTVFQKAHPENDKILKALTSASVRKISESPATILNAAYFLSYNLAPQEALKTDQEAEKAKNKEMRDVLRRYRQPENLKKIANNLYLRNETTRNWLKAPDKYPRPALPLNAVSFYIVYVGTFRFGEYAHHIRNMQFFSAVNPVYSCIVFELGNKFYINFRQPFQSQLYINILMEELHIRGVNSTRIENQ